MCNFVNLHVHSMYSLLDSISKPEDIIRKVKRMNQPAIAITEHGNAFSAVKVFKECKKNGVKFIYGVEAYICKNRFEKDKNNRYYHLTILAKNEQGRKNINKLITLANLEGVFYKPRIDLSLLKEHKDGLIILSGCMSSEIQRTLASGNYNGAKEIANHYRSIFGSDYYLEVQSHSDPVQQSLNRQIVDIGKELGIPWVTTADSHFIDDGDKELHGIFVQIGQEREVGETYLDTQLQSEEEARRLLRHALTEDEIDVAIRNTMHITDKCNVQIPLSPPLIPHVKVPDEYKTENDYIKALCNKGWVSRGLNKLSKEEQKIYMDRLMYEYNAINEMGFIGYYLLVHSYISIAKRHLIGRGSAGGSLIAYLLNIVDINPIKYGLYFERFVDVGALDLLKRGVIKPEELKVPDVDSDLSGDEREKVIQFIVDTYGKDRVACIGTFQYMMDKSAIKDVGRVLGIPFDITNEITSLLGDENLKDALESGSLHKHVSQYPKLFDYAQRLSGLPRQFGKHPCGRGICIDELTHYAPITQSDGEYVHQIDMKDVESLGIVKIDLLGLNTVDVVWDTLEMIGKDFDYVSPDNLNFKDEKALQVFRDGYTDGIFQFESAIA